MKKTKPEQNTFSIKAFPSSLEDETRSLHELVLCGAEPLLRSWENQTEMLNHAASRHAFFCAAHQGFHKAQNHIVEAVTNPTENPVPVVTLAMYRRIMDCVAWQMLEMQLYAVGAINLRRWCAPVPLNYKNKRSTSLCELLPYA